MELPAKVIDFGFLCLAMDIDPLVPSRLFGLDAMRTDPESF